MNNRAHLIPQLLIDSNGVKRIYYINPEDPADTRVVDYLDKYPEKVFRATPTAITKTISFFYDEDNNARLYVEGEDGDDIDFSPEELDGLSAAVERKIDRDIRDGEIWSSGNISIILKDGWDYTPEDDTVVIRDNRTRRRIKVKWQDIRLLARKNDMLIHALGRSRKKIKARNLEGGDIVDIYPDLQEAYNALDPSQLDSEQAEMLEVLIAECEDNYFLIEEVEFFNDHVTIYNGKSDKFDIELDREIQVDSHDITANPIWGEVS